jgi:hypothetical protein
MRFLFFLHLASTGIVYFQKSFHISLVLVLAPRLIFAGIHTGINLVVVLVYGKYVLAIDLDTYLTLTWSFFYEKLSIANFSQKSFTK